MAIEVLLAGCANGTAAKKQSAVCHSIHENPVLFDKVLIGRQPVGQIPLNTLTPAKIVTSKLGKPDETMPVSNVLFSWWRYGNTAYLVADLAANRAGYQYIAAKACNWKRTSALLTGIAKP